MKSIVALAVALAACGGIAPRFPQDVQTTLAHDDMRRLETARFIIYYPAARRAQVDRFLTRADGCAVTLREHSLVHGRDRKFVIVMPDSPFNNAFVAPDALGYEEVSVVPAHSTLDFTTLFGLPPDPGLIACHELAHYVHVQQTAGFWGTWNSLFGHLYTPQIGYDPWFFEGLATHYEARLTGVGRPVWPVFTGMFAAAYAGKPIGGGDMSAFARMAPTGHHYLVGSMFVRFLAERYGERPLWQTIKSQASAFTGFFFTGTFEDGFGVELGTLLDQFETWVHHTFPVRKQPANQQRLEEIGNDARYARGRDGTEAWVYEDVDVPPRLRVRGPDGQIWIDTALVEVVPPRTLIQASPLLVSGLSITSDGEVWLTALDQGSVFQLPRLLRWRRGDSSPMEISDSLGPGATIDPTGKTYYYCHVDGDRWSLARWDVATRKAQILVDMKPGTYVLGAQVSPGGDQLAANVWDGRAFAIWIVDAASGRILRQITGANGTPVYDASFSGDGRVIYLGVVDGRFQVFVDGKPVSDAPYAALAPREANGNIRFLDRQDWSWHLAQIDMPARYLADADAPAPLAASPIAPPSAAVPVQTDEAYSAFDHFFYPQVRSPSLAIGGGVPHFGLALGGGDRLDLHRWSLQGYAQPSVADVGTRTHYGAYAAYYNQMLAPVTFIADAGFLDWAAPVADAADPAITYTEEHKTRDASAGFAYTWRQSLSAYLSGIYTSDAFSFEDEPYDRVWVGGPSLALSWFSGEYTRFTGVRRAIFATSETAFYPERLSSFTGDITDVGGTLGGTVPLPIGRRHTITGFVRSRSLIAREDTGLLQVGGSGALGAVWDRSSATSPPPEFDSNRFPPNLRFVEPLRGYEDYAITTDRVLIGEVSWRYPIIIDEGRASLWILPAAFLRQLDLGLFASGAIDRQRDEHYAAGASVTLRLQFFRVPLAVTYQIARRIVDDKALTQLVGIGPDI